MKKKDKYFNNNKGNGYIEYKENGKVSIYLFVNGIIKEFELGKIKD
jgi:hypothetical protein